MAQSKTALVTGASSGLGAHFGALLARQGYHVLLAARRQDKVAALAEAIAAEGGSAEALEMDVTSSASVAAGFAAMSRLPDTVINNAGIAGDRPALEMSQDVFDQVMNTNLKGVFLVSQAAARGMRDRGKGGVIVNISSLSAKTGGMPTDVMYAASKGAVDSFTLGLAKEVGKEGIRVVAVRPGLTRTEIFDNYPGGMERVDEMARETTAIGRIAEPDEIAELAVWLASPKASYVTSALIDITGGR